MRGRLHRRRWSERAISYEKFAKMMESSYRRHFKAGETIFKQGDAVDGFYILTLGECMRLAAQTPPAGSAHVIVW